MQFSDLQNEYTYKYKHLGDITKRVNIWYSSNSIKNYEIESVIKSDTDLKEIIHINILKLYITENSNDILERWENVKNIIIETNGEKLHTAIYDKYITDLLNVIQSYTEIPNIKDKAEKFINKYLINLAICYIDYYKMNFITKYKNKRKVASYPKRPFIYNIYTEIGIVNGTMIVDREESLAKLPPIKNILNIFNKKSKIYIEK